MKEYTERKDFLRGYWVHYLMIEEEFLKTLPFLSLCEDNDNAFSDAYLKLILEIGSAADVALKKYCRILEQDSEADNICKYCELIDRIIGNKFTNKSIELRKNADDLSPISTWQGWSCENSPEWWRVYNKVKHERMDKVQIGCEPKQKAYKYANQKYTLQALAGLYQVLAFTYHEIVKDDDELVPYPTPESKLFKPLFELGKAPDRTNIELINNACN